MLSNRQRTPAKICSFKIFYAKIPLWFASQISEFLSHFICTTVDAQRIGCVLLTWNWYIKQNERCSQPIQSSDLRIDLSFFFLYQKLIFVMPINFNSFSHLLQLMETKFYRYLWHCISWCRLKSTARTQHEIKTILSSRDTVVRTVHSDEIDHEIPLRREPIWKSRKIS